MRLPTWAGWIALTTWGLGWGLAGLLLGRHLALRHLDHMLDTAQRLRQEADRKIPVVWIKDSGED